MRFCGYSAMLSIMVNIPHLSPQSLPASQELICKTEHNNKRGTNIHASHEKIVYGDIDAIL